MKTRIIYTKFWEDDYIGGLNLSEKILFIYLLTNSKIGLIDIYECSDRVILFETGLNSKQLEEAKSKFIEDKKFLFKDGWVKIINCEKYNQYSGEKNKVAKEREISYIPDSVLEYFDRVSIGYRYSSDSLINHKSEIINHKSEIKNKENEKNNNDNNDNKKEKRERKEEKAFNIFWEEYPRKIGKSKSRELFKKIILSRKELKERNELFKEIIYAIRKQKKSKAWEDIKFIPHPATWLNQGRWEDNLSKEELIYN